MKEKFELEAMLAEIKHDEAARQNHGHAESRKDINHMIREDRQKKEKAGHDAK